MLVPTGVYLRRVGDVSERRPTTELIGSSGASGSPGSSAVSGKMHVGHAVAANGITNPVCSNWLSGWHLPSGTLRLSLRRPCSGGSSVA
ncbi:hypothetical protein VTN96DRAFT_10115 [Rasamsonia emersonii]